MGWNTTIMILNDAADLITTDADFPEKLRQAILAVGSGIHDNSRGQIDVSIWNHCNACTVIEKHHADQTNLIAVGGNCATVVHRAFGSTHHTPESQERLLRDWADAMGFRLARKPKK